jgi:dTDP-4-dehydrorhamnose reductase
VDTFSGLIPPGGVSFVNPVGPDEFDVVSCARDQLDVANESEVHRVIRECQPDAIVHLAAYTAVDAAETDEETCRRINVDGTRYLADAAASVGAHLVAISSDYVFDGTSAVPYEEHDPRNPLGAYGRSKRDGEDAVTDDVTMIRASWVMGSRGKNVVRAVLPRLANGGEVRFVTDQIGTPTMAADLSQVLVEMVRQRPGGRWHVANRGETSWCGVIAAEADILGSGTVIPILTSDLSPAPIATRPAHSALSTAKLHRELGIVMPEWRDGLQRLLTGAQ